MPQLPLAFIISVERIDTIVLRDNVHNVANSSARNCNVGHKQGLAIQVAIDWIRKQFAETPNIHV